VNESHRNMAAEIKKEIQLEIAHVLFIDIVGYSKLSINEQRAAIDELTQIVRSTEQFQKAEAADRLIKIATGDGMALVFYTSPETPVRCAVELSRALKDHPRLRIRMGIHSGPVSGVVDVTGRTNLAGAGLNLARRVMDCGDAGHILLSKHVAEDLSEFEEWRPMLHELGTCEVKHGMQVHVFNLYTDELGNSRLPEKLKQSRHEKDAAASVAQKRIAVLPFKPVLPESRDLVLELGMADTLITKLSNSREVIVRSLTSVRKYGGLEQDPVSAGRELEVNSVLEGNVQRVGDRIRVTARLIKVADGSSLWAATFDEEFTDVFSVQDAISQKVADALALRLSREENKRLTKRYTDNVEAYQLYLTGLYHWNKLTLPEIRKSIGFFNQAIDLDPTYALAYFGLAYAYVAFAPMSDMPPKDVLPQGKAAATKALEIDESLAEAHATLAFIHTLFDWDWAEAEKEAKRAIALYPNLALAHMAYAELLCKTGRHQEAITEGTRAQELDPLSLIINTLYGSYLYQARRNEEATARLQKTIELDPNFWLAYLLLGKIYFNKGKYPEAIAEFSKATELSGGNSEPISMTGYAWAMAGDPAKARAVLKELKSLSSQRYVPGTSLGALCYAVGEKDEAFTWLEQAYEDRDLRLSQLKVEPKWDAMRSEPRFVAILKRIGLQ
jgi:TolB-like protein/Flp pilus assembly protein TadD/class 3 adenylate cyclase